MKATSNRGCLFVWEGNNEYKLAGCIGTVNRDGIIITDTGFLLQYIIHRQNIELDKRKRSDYFLSRNYDKLFEIGIKLEQLVVHWYREADNVSKTGGQLITDLWNSEFQVIFGKEEQLSLSKFLHIYHLMFPFELRKLLLDMNDAYIKRDYKLTKDKSVEITKWLRKSLGIKCSEDEIRRIFNQISEA